MQIAEIVGVVLAGGKSSRMGSDKAKLKIGRYSLLEWALHVLERAQVTKAIVSGGDNPDAIDDQQAFSGPLGGMKSVVTHLMGERHLGYIFVPVDMPALTVQLLDQLIRHGVRNNAACSYQGHYLPLYLPNKKKADKKKKKKKGPRSRRIEKIQ